MNIILLQHWNCLLNQDGAVVKVLVRKVDGAAGNLYPIFQRLLLRLKAGKGRKQRRVNVEDPVRKRANKIWREKTHVSSQANQLHLGLAQGSYDLRIMFLADAALGGNQPGIQPAPPRRRQARS